MPCLLILGRAPGAFDGDVVGPAAFAIHADVDASLLEPIREGHQPAGLIGVEGFRFAVLAQSLFECSRQNGTSIVIGNRQLSTLRPCG